MKWFKKILFLCAILITLALGYLLFLYLFHFSFPLGGASNVHQNESGHISPPLVQSAREQIGVTRVYDPAYVQLEYPMGDVVRSHGVCTDVVIRALRDAYGMDLQKLVHEDMKEHFSDYPKIWGLEKPDPNIDHRRVPNLRRYFERSSYELPLSKNPDDYRAGDIVTSDIFGRPHIMIVSDRKTFHGRPYVIHNSGRGTQEEDILFYYPLTGHYRIPLETK